MNHYEKMIQKTKKIGLKGKGFDSKNELKGQRTQFEADGQNQ